MTELANRKDIPISDMLTEVRACSGNPLRVMQVGMDMLDEVLGGSVQIVDASSPWAFLTETSAVVHAASVQEGVALLRDLYPSLAQTPAHLYRHMSNWDYLNRFSSPAITDFTFYLQFDQLKQQMVRPEDANYVKAIIPRDTKVTVDKDLSFMLQYPVEIRLYDSNSLQVSYLTDILSPFQSLSTNIVEPRIVEEEGGATWVKFTLPLLQVEVISMNDNIQRGRYFTKDIEFKDQFYYARAFHQSNSTGNKWVEMQTTHSPTVYDPNVPTVQLQVVENVLSVSLPMIYQTNGQVIGGIRVDVYTCKGATVLDLSTYPTNSFILTMAPLDPVRDTSVYTNVLSRVSSRANSSVKMAGGSNEVSFNTLRERIIHNSVGEIDIPITNIQLAAKVDTEGFELVPNVDVVTNRIFLATRSLPPPSNLKLTTSANIGIATFVTTDPSTINHPWVSVNVDRTTFLSKNLYKSDDGVIKLLSVPEVESLDLLPTTTKVNTLNRNKYLYTPFYYVVDRSSLELQVRAYHLDNPKAENINFMTQNQSLQLVVNTGSYKLFKVDTGYKLQIQTKSGNHYKALADQAVQAQLGIYPHLSSKMVYWNAVQVGRTVDNERIFEFTIDTNYDIDANDRLSVTNGSVEGLGQIEVLIDLLEDMNIFHTTSSLTTSFKPDASNDLIGKFMLPSPVAAITREVIQGTFGYSLKNLWNRGRTLPDQSLYKRYAVDVPLTYPKTVYKRDPLTGSAVSIVGGQISYDVLFNAGEPVLDEDNNPVYSHRAGDLYLVDGLPEVDSVRVGRREMDMLFVDGRHYFVDDSAFVDYNEEFVEVLANWILNDIKGLQDRALEKTKIFFYPKNQLGEVTVLLGEGEETPLEAEQSFVVDVYVRGDIYRDIQMRKRLEGKTILYLDKWIAGDTVSVSDATTDLKNIYGDSAASIRISGLGGLLNLQLANISAKENRFCLKRILSTQQDGTYIIKEDVVVNFYNADPQKA